MSKQNKQEQIRKEIKCFLKSLWWWSYENGKWLDSAGDEISGAMDLEQFILGLTTQTRQEAVEEERKRIKGAFIEHFAGAGEIFFPYVGVGDTDLDDEITAAHQEWNEIIKSLSQEKK